jgi:hypothetical protein
MQKLLKPATGRPADFATDGRAAVGVEERSGADPMRAGADLDRLRSRPDNACWPELPNNPTER